MAFSSGTSCLISTSLFVVLFSGMQVYRWQLASSQLMTVLGGFLGSFLFMFALTAIGNIETYAFGKGFHTKLFPEVLISILVSVFACGLVHRVCITTCIIFSTMVLYYMNKISNKVYGATVPPTLANPLPEKKKRK
ncbi:protein KRTCAP2 homolog [Trichonephila clavata]|uniref:Protein KRTCAP2 homolog n=1 Tax=Trichonephila clavata TaxID=2740835 RepID=A0A8X6GL58_TRICU|nr:protein KRTCAP2 homolog [Trichonephila clavata]